MEKTRGAVGIVTNESFMKGLIKVGMKLRQELGGRDNDEDLKVNIITVAGLTNSEIRFEIEGGDWDVYDVSAFEPTAEEEAKAYQRLYFLDDVSANEYMLINVKRNVVVAYGSRDEITTKVLNFRQGGGEKVLADLRIIPTSAMKEVKLTLDL